MEENIIVLEDENGVEVECEVIDVFDLDAVRYVAMIDAAEPEDSEECDVILMKLLNHENPEEAALVAIEDEEELNKVFDEFLKRDEEYSE